MNQRTITISFEVDDFGGPMPGERPTDARLEIQWGERVGTPGHSVEITGNRAGLQYLARTLLALAHARADAESWGFHFHIDATGKHGEVDLELNLLAKPA